jgi:integrase
MLSCDNISGATRATEKGADVARRRWQGGHLFRRGKRNPVWIGRFREDYIAEDGTRKRRKLSVVLGPVRELGKRQVERRLSERLASINQGRHKPEVMISFGRFVIERWEPNLFPTLRLSTARKYKHVSRAYLFPVLGKVNLADIGAAEVQSLISHWSRRLAPYTVLTIRNVLSKIFATAVRWGSVHANPVEGVQVPALINRRERLALKPDEVRRLLAVLSEPYQTMVLLAVLSGLRRGELFGLRWKAVDFAEGSITVSESLSAGRAAPVKTRASRRKVFVDSIVFDALRGLRPAQYQPDDYVFTSGRGLPLHVANVQGRVLNPACERAGIPHVTWHNFRYTYSTWANPTNESIKALQAQLGHTDSRLTLSVYTQPMPEAQRAIGHKVAGVLAPNGPKFDVGGTPVSRLVQ